MANPWTLPETCYGFFPTTNALFIPDWIVCNAKFKAIIDLYNFKSISFKRNAEMAIKKLNIWIC